MALHPFVITTWTFDVYCWCCGAASGPLKNNHEGANYLQMTGSLHLSDAATTLGAHFSPQPTLVLQLKGEQQVWVAPQHQLNHTYHYERGHLLFHNVRVDIKDPDLHAFPAAKSLRPKMIRLFPGDFLILPGFMAHQLETVTDSIFLEVGLQTARTPSKARSSAKEARASIHIRDREMRHRVPLSSSGQHDPSQLGG